MEDSILSLPPINRHGFGEEDTEIKPYKIHVCMVFPEPARFAFPSYI